MSEEKSLYDYKIGEVCNRDLGNGLLEAPNKCVAISVTFQNKDGSQMEVKCKHPDFMEDEEDDN